MIATLNGRIIDIYSDCLVLGVGEIGLQVFVPAPLKDRLHPGEELFLHTHLIVREDLLNLYGFETREEHDLFLLFLGVDGIGPKLALSVVSFLSPDIIRRAIYHEQVEVFTRVPGVGKKTAQKILLYLKDRISELSGVEPVSVIKDEDTEIITALTSLGYSVVEAQAAIQSIPRDAPEDLETRLRIALQFFG